MLTVRTYSAYFCTPAIHRRLPKRDPTPSVMSVVLIFQMYGEKVEEAEELRLDLEDVKEMYKTQIDELLHTGSSSQAL